MAEALPAFRCQGCGVSKKNTRKADQMRDNAAAAKGAMGTIFSGVAWVGRATVFLVGLAVVLALTVGVAGAALAANGGNLILGQNNVASAITQLAGSAGVAGPSLLIDNNSADPAATALDLQVEAGRPPMKVSSDTKVANLNADKLDGIDSGSYFFRTYVLGETSEGAGSEPALEDVFCDAGDFVLGGGYSGVDRGTHVLQSGPNSLNGVNERGWSVRWSNDSTRDTISVTAVCADRGALHQ